MNLLRVGEAEGRGSTREGRGSDLGSSFFFVMNLWVSY